MAADTIVTIETPVGYELPPVSRKFEVEDFAAGGAKTIHNDQAAAEREGLPGPIAVGPQVAALIYRMMHDSFGGGWIVGGDSDLTFRRPVAIDERATARGTVTDRQSLPDGHVRVVCDVWVETASGVKAIVGNCSGLVAA
jgi:acyl dehydratase